MIRNGRLAGKVAVVTGGASGIGLASTRRFVAEGAHVVVADLDSAGLQRVKEELGEVVETCLCDVASEPEVEAVVGRATAAFGRLDILFANAGIGGMAPVVDVDVDEWMRVIQVNLLGPLLGIKHAARAMQSGSSIVLTASLNAVQPAKGMSAYCCSKAGLAMLANVAAMELGASGIRVNAIGPGLVRTGLTDGMWLMPAIVDAFMENAPLGVPSTPDDVANLVTFLASDESRTITGALYLVDGGAHTQRYPDMSGLLPRLSQA